MSATWKPSDRLTPDDFVRAKAWTNDLARAARDDRFDDWVRPARAGDPLTDDVFVSATLLGHDGSPIPRSVLRMRAPTRKGGSPVPTALVVLSPYKVTPLEDQALPLDASESLRRVAPISYEVDVKIGSQRWRAKGRIAARGLPATSSNADEEEARRQALIEAALARVKAAQTLAGRTSVPTNSPQKAKTKTAPKATARTAKAKPKPAKARPQTKARTKAQLPKRR